MEIIFNNAVTDSVTGKIRKRSPWYIRQRNGKYHAAFRGGKKYKMETFRVFYHDLLKLQRAKYIQSITLNETERRWLKL